ncbi:unnamed protein product, partial [Meganyctiphanes norvegica]
MFCGHKILNGNLKRIKKNRQKLNIYDFHPYGKFATSPKQFKVHHLKQYERCVRSMQYPLLNKPSPRITPVRHIPSTVFYVNWSLSTYELETGTLQKSDKNPLGPPFTWLSAIRWVAGNTTTHRSRRYPMRRHVSQSAHAHICYLWLCLFKKTLEKCAVKIISKKTSPSSNKDTSHLHHMENEIKILHTINHPFIIGLKECIDTEEYIYIVMELAQEGDLLEHIKEKKRLPENEAKFFFYQLVLAVQYLHEKSITHRDIKLENIILSRKDKIFIVKLSDLGLSVAGISEIHGKCGSISYMAPEMLSRGRLYTNKVDMWSLGVVLFTCLPDQIQLATDDPGDINSRITTVDYNVYDEMSDVIVINARTSPAKLPIVFQRHRFVIPDSMTSTSWDSSTLYPSNLVLGLTSRETADLAKKSHDPSKKKDQAQLFTFHTKNVTEKDIVINTVI